MVQNRSDAPAEREEQIDAARRRLLGRDMGRYDESRPEELAGALQESLLVNDSDQARKVLDEAHRHHPLRAVLLDVIAPVLVEIGTAWEKGFITTAMEHRATSMLRRHVIRHLREEPGSGPRVVVTTLPDEQHEGGALLLTVLLAHDGFDIDYLGPDTPLEDLRKFARDVRPDAVVLSVPSPAPLSTVPEGALSSMAAPVLLGGLGAKEARDRLELTGGVYVGADLHDVVDKVKKGLRQVEQVRSS